MRNTVIESHNGQLMSKTQHYRKVTKPLLERKRRARMNHYLDELKHLIVETMEAQGEHITKLEKADILEMTVTYLKNKNQSHLIDINNGHDNMIRASSVSPIPSTSSSSSPPINPEKFRAGYTQAAYEVSKVFASVPGLDVDFGTKLMKHLGYKLKDLNPPQEQLSVITINQQCRSPSLSPLLHNNINNNNYNTNNDNEYEFKKLEDLSKEQQQQQDESQIVVITPPQSPNIIQQQKRPFEMSLNRSKKVYIMEKLIEEQQKHQNCGGDVWRPW